MIDSPGETTSVQPIVVGTLTCVVSGTVIVLALGTVELVVLVVVDLRVLTLCLVVLECDLVVVILV